MVMTVAMSCGIKGRRQARMLTAINERYTADRHGPCVVQVEGLRHEYNGETGAEVLEYVVTMSRNNVLCIARRCKQSVEGKWLTILTGYHLEKWNAKANEQIDYDTATLF